MLENYADEDLILSITPWPVDDQSVENPKDIMPEATVAPTFSGDRGEDPDEFLDDLTYYVEVTKREIPGRDPNFYYKTNFRKNLKGKAKDWYLSLPKDKREDWKALQELFKHKFENHVSRKDPSVGYLIDSFDRGANESLPEYIRRADRLADEASERQEVTLKDKLWKNMANNGHVEDQIPQKMMYMMLETSGSLGDDGEIKDSVGYWDVRKHLLKCVRVPGKEAEFYAVLEGNHRRENGVGSPRLPIPPFTQPLPQYDSVAQAQAWEWSQRRNQAQYPQQQMQPPSYGYQQQTYGPQNNALVPQANGSPSNMAQQHQQQYQPQMGQQGYGYGMPTLPPFQQQYGIMPQYQSQQFPRRETRFDQQGGYQGQNGRRSGDQNGPGQREQNQQRPQGYQTQNNDNNRQNQNYQPPRRGTFGCWNCGSPRHAMGACPCEDRPWSEKEQIRDALRDNQPIPAHLQKPPPLKGEANSSNNAVPAQTVAVENDDGLVDIPHLFQAMTLPGETNERRFDEEHLDVWGGRTVPSLINNRVNRYRDTHKTPSEAPAAPVRPIDDEDVDMDVADLAEGSSRQHNDAEQAGKDSGAGERPISSPQQARRVPSQPVPSNPRKRVRHDTPLARSPEGRLPGKPLPSHHELAERLRQHKNKFMERRQERQQRRRKDTVPIRAFEDRMQERLNVVRIILDAPMPQMTVGQYLDRSPHSRAQLSQALGLSTVGRQERVDQRRRQRENWEIHSAHSEPETSKTEGTCTTSLNITYGDRAMADKGQGILCYIEGEVDGRDTERAMLDEGSLSELISPACVERLKLEKHPIGKGYHLKLADDKKVPIEYYVVFPFRVGGKDGIISIIRALVAGQGESYDILLGKGWLIRMQAVTYHAEARIEFRGTEGMGITLGMLDRDGNYITGNVEYVPDDGVYTIPARRDDKSESEHKHKDFKDTRGIESLEDIEGLEQKLLDFLKIITQGPESPIALNDEDEDEQYLEIAQSAYALAEMAVAQLAMRESDQSKN